MKKNEVPQDESKLIHANIREVCYAVDENGEYTTALSTGWDPKSIALDNALQHIDERVALAKNRVLQNEASPLEYYMELHKMDPQILASYVGFWKWRVKRHFKPAVFNKLPFRVLQKYADVFEVSVEDLKDIKP